MTTIEYVFIDGESCTVTSNQLFEIKLGNSNKDRPPNQIIEIISLSLNTTKDETFIQIRTDLMPSNSFTNDGYQACLGVLMFDQIGPEIVVPPSGPNIPTYNYYLSGYEQPKYIISNTIKFNLSFVSPVENIESTAIVDFAMMLKITTPAQGEIQKDYRKQIPL